MNILFLTVGGFGDIEEHGIYPDLLRTFRDRGHKVFVVSPLQRREQKPTEYYEKHGIQMLKVKIGNITKCGIIEKGISTVMVGMQYKRAIKKYFSNVKFDLIVYSTPPITLAGVVRDLKNKTHAVTYLMLKDIFPQNAVDLGILTQSGLKGLLYRYFRGKEKRLYAVSDYIGCMSPANVWYILEHNPNIPKERVEVLPNCIDTKRIDTGMERQRQETREKMDIALDEIVYIVGGNLSYGHDFPFALKMFYELEEENEKFRLLFVGAGTEVDQIKNFISENKSKRISYIPNLPVEDYNKLVSACDVGVILLDKRFTIPNFPSKLLSYMQAKKPVFTISDQSSDVGIIAKENKFGWYCIDGDAEGFRRSIDEIRRSNLTQMGENAWNYMLQEYDADKNGEKILKHIEK